MKNDKILNFLIALFLTIIIFNLIVPKKQQTANNDTITVKTQKSDYTIPNLPIIQITNNTQKQVSFDTCKDLVLTKDGQKIENIGKNIPKFCYDVKIDPSKTENLNLNPVAKIFSNAGEYDLNVKINNKDYRIHFSESEKGFFNNLFSTLFYAPVYNLFVMLISFLPDHSLGLAIILVTLIIRLIVLVPQQRIMLNSKRMQSIQPKIKEIQDKYKGDQSKIGMELLELYKKEKVNPMGSCLPLMIQLPLLIVLYWTISGITSAGNYYYLYGPLSNFDISTINPHFLGLDLIKQEWKSGLILAILIGGFQWLQIKMSLLVREKKKDHGKIVEKEVKVDDPISEFMPDPNMMNNFMLWGMPVMLAFSSYFFPSGVGIYWLIGTIFTLLQQYVVNKISEKDASPKTKEGHEIITKK